jgi:hypothetical protein
MRRCRRHRRCIVSSPLVLGLELTDEKLSPIMEIIGNEQAIAINQAWAGHPGTLVRTLPPVAPPTPKLGKFVVAVPCDATDATQVGWSWSKADGSLRFGAKCLSSAGGAAIARGELAEMSLAACDGTEPQLFAFDDAKHTFGQAGKCLDIYEPDAEGARRIDLWACNGGKNQEWTLDAQALTSTYAQRESSPRSRARLAC